MKTLTPKLKKEIEEIKSTLDMEKAVLTRIETAKIRALEILEDGHEIQGWDREKAFGNRAWIKDLTPEKAYHVFKAWINKKSDVETKPTLKSPSQLQKYFDDVPEAQDLLEDLVTREDKGYKIIKKK